MTEERVHRRLAAVLAADVVGYSRLMGQDESATLAALKPVARRFSNPLFPKRTVLRSLAADTNAIFHAAW